MSITIDLPKEEFVESVAYWMLDRLQNRKNIKEGDVLYKANVSFALSFMDGDLDEKLEGQSVSLGLRVIDAEGRQGIAYTNMLTKDVLTQVIEWATYNCQNNDPNPFAGLNHECNRAFQDQDIFDPLIAEGPGFERGEKICSSISDEVRCIDKRVTSIREAFYGEGYEQTLYLSSAGFYGWQRETVARCDVTLIMSDDNKVEIGGFGEERRYANDLDYLSIARHAVQRTGLTLGGNPLKSGRYIVILDSVAAASIVSLLEDSLLADSVHKGKSWLAGKLGHQIVSCNVNLVDDATVKRGIGSYAFDGEGVPAQRTVLLESGILTNFLYNLEHARMDGVPSTGNCVRGTGSLPEVGASNLFITPGTRNLRSLLSGINFGIYVVDLLGLHTFDPTTGDLSLGVKGACIKKGMIEEPVSGMTIAGNIYDILSRVVEVGSDLKFYGSVGSPSLVIEDVASAGN